MIGWLALLRLFYNHPFRAKTYTKTAVNALDEHMKTLLMAYWYYKDHS